jgi:anti-anti-sigma factor
MALSEDGTSSHRVRGVARPFEVQEVVSGGRHTLVLAGELDMATTAELEPMIVACAESAGGLTLDLRQLSFMDSTGLKLVLFAQQVCQANRAEFALIPGPRQVQRVFELTSLMDRLPFQSEPTN